MQIIRNISKSLIPLAVVITLLAGLMYATVQQVLRMNANDPQIQMAEDAASALAAGKPLDSVVPAAQVDVATSLAPFIVVYDHSGKAIASTGLLHGQLPALPPGVFDYVRQKGEDRITWQPEPGIRSATVVTHYGGALPGFVMAGRSLRESESRTDQLGLIIGLGWLGTLFAAWVAVSLSELVLGSDRWVLGSIPTPANRSAPQTGKTKRAISN